MSKTIDYRLGIEVEIEARKGADFHRRFHAQYVSGTTYVDVGLAAYSAATLQVRRKPNSPIVELTFSTTDSSIVLGTDGRFDLNKGYALMDGLRAGEYYYDMYLSNATYPKRDFMYGKFIIYDKVTL